jgi:hypothetical protein
MEEEVLIPEVVEDVTLNDKCPTCNTLTNEFKYISMLPQLGWLECTTCGTVFCPESIRTQKIRDRLANQFGVPEARRIIVPR